VVVVRDQKGRSPSRSIRLAVYARDRYICRYRHCQRATVDERVVAALALLMPQALPYHRNWPADRAHPLVWTHLASLEHVKPWSTGGDNSLDNLVTTCSLCNYTKNNASVAQLNWQVNVETREDIVWDGLTSLLPQLQRMVNER
jgi:5-methylcytosine-specific restriction endonuclease McrA